MRTTFLTIVLVVAQLFSTQAMNSNDKTVNDNSNITIAQLTDIFEWTVTTKSGTFSGTSLSLEKAYKMVSLVSQGESISEQIIVKYTVLKSKASNKDSRKYYWEVVGSKGNAKGFASSKSIAKRMVELASSAQTISYKIIEYKK